MKKYLFIFLLILSHFNLFAQKSIPTDSTLSIIKEWIAEISSESNINDLKIRGMSQEQYLSSLKLINLSLEDYQKGRYQYAFEDINEVKNIDNFSEIKRIKLFMLTMTEIKLNKRFKARKWYYVSQNEMASASFTRLKNNVANQKLTYKINNYKRVRGARLSALAIIGGLFVIVGALGE